MNLKSPHLFSRIYVIFSKVILATDYILRWPFIAKSQRILFTRFSLDHFTCGVHQMNPIRKVYLLAYNLLYITKKIFIMQQQESTSAMVRSQQKICDPFAIYKISTTTHSHQEKCIILQMQSRKIYFWCRDKIVKLYIMFSHYDHFTAHKHIFQ